MELKRILKEHEQGDDVAALQMRLNGIGYGIGNDEHVASFFGAQTRAAVMEFQGDHQLTQTGTVDDGTSTTLARVYRDALYAVSGYVVSKNDAHILGGMSVELIDRSIEQDHLLATTTTREDGSFTFIDLVISQKSLLSRHKSKPDLQVRLLGVAGPLATSKVHYNAPSKVRLNVSLPSGVKGLPSEVEALTAVLNDVYPGKFSSLQETPERQDITYLANKVGWDPRAIMSLIAAHRVSETNGVPTSASASTSPIPPELFYALFRAGVTADSDCFLTAPKRVETIWQQAIADNVIPSSFADQAVTALTAFKQIGASHSLSAKSPIGVSTLSEMLAETLPETEKQVQFAALYIEHHDAPTGLWPEVAKAFGEEKSKQLQFDGQLFKLTRNNAPLVKALKSAEAAKPLATMRDLAAAGYDSAERWIPLIAGPVPPGIEGTTAEEQQSNYADRLAAQMRVAYPTDVLANQIKRGTLPTEGGSQLANDVHAFLTTHAEDFKFGEEPIEAYLSRKQITGIAVRVVEHVKRLHRVYQITPDDRSMSVLLRHKLDSASAIVRYKPAAFERAFADKLGSPEQAKLVHQRATQVYNTVLNTAVTYLAARAQPNLGVSTAAPSASSTRLIQPLLSPAADAASTPSATLESLFGSLDYCDCSDCGSILSAAAYFVDLLNFLDVPIPTPGFSDPQAVLFGRRPDLQYLSLTCENTNTALPYIDLVNEVLEAFIANNLSLDGYQGHDTGDDFSSVDLLASPQFVNDAAYSALRTSYFPVPLPFDRSLEQLRLQFASLGVSLPDLMIALRVNNQWINDTTNGHLPISYGWVDIMLELVQISWDELNLFSGDDTDIPDIDVGALYGLPNDATALPTLQSMNLQTFTRRLGISYDHITAILQTRYINQDAVLIPLLQQLQMPITNLVDLKSGVLSRDTFKAMLPAGIDATKYGGTNPGDLDAIAVWAIGPASGAPVGSQVPVYPRLMDIITIADPSGLDACTATSLNLRYTNPDPTAGLLTKTDYIRIVHFVRLWQKLAAFFGTTDNALSIQQTADVFDAFYPTYDLPIGAGDPTNDESNFQLVADGFAKMIPCLSFAAQIMTMLSLNAQDSLPQLLACWSDIQTAGPNSLYTQLFLTPSVLQQDQLGQTATVAGYFNPGQVVTVSINGVALSYTVQLNDMASDIASHLAQAINRDGTHQDPDTSLPMNKRFYASTDGGVIIIQVGFDAVSSVSSGATEILLPGPGANTPLNQSFIIGGTVTPGDVLTILVNQVPVSIVVQAGDSTDALLQRFVDAFGNATSPDAYSGAPLNTVVLAAVENGSVTLTAANTGAPFDLTCAVGVADTGGITYSPYDFTAATITLGGTAVVGDTVTVVLTPAIAEAPYVYTAVAADSDVIVFAANLAAFLVTSTGGNRGFTATSADSTITIHWPGERTWIGTAAYTVAATLSDTANSTIAIVNPRLPGYTVTVADDIPPTAIITIKVSSYTVQYTVLTTDTAATIATALTALINALAPAGTGAVPVSATCQGNVLTVVINTGIFGNEATIAVSVSVMGGFSAGALSEAGFVANLTPAHNVYGAHMTTIIDGILVPFTVATNDDEVYPSDICESINTCTLPDPISKLPINQTVAAYPATAQTGAAILIVSRDPRSSFTVTTTYSSPAPSEYQFTYTVGPPTNALQTITVTEPLSPRVVLTTTINGTSFSYTISADDTATTIANNIVTLINTSPLTDPASGLTMSALFTITAASGVITIAANEFTTPLVLSVASSVGTCTPGRQQSPFTDDGYGNLLKDLTQTVLGYEPLLCAACNLTGSEFALIVNALGFNATTPLTLENVSSIYRYGWLPHTLGISVLEFLELRACTQLDPFLTLFPGQPPDTVPPAIHFIHLLQALEAAGLKPVQALYLMWNDDITGTAAPTQAQIHSLAFTLRQDFGAVNAQFAIVSDPDGSIAASLMALVYTSTTTDFFFGLLNNTIQPAVAYSAPPDQSTLPPSLVSLAGGLLTYDGLRKQLSFAGLLSDATAATLQTDPVLINTSDSTINAPAGAATIFTPASMANIQIGSEVWVDTGALEELVTVAAITATTFTAHTLNAHNGTTTPVAIVDALFVAISALAASSDAVANPFFAQYPELQPLYAAYKASTGSLEDKRTTLLANFIPTLRSERKQEQALAAITAAVGTDPSFATSLLNDALVLQADQNARSAAIVDLTAIESGGLSLPYGVADTSGTTWAGAIDVPQDGYYNLSIALSADVTVTVSIGGVQIAGAVAGGEWSNQSPLSFVAGSPTFIEVIYSMPVDSVALSWQTTGIGWQPVPTNYLYPINLLVALQGTYVRFLKAASLATILSVTANEIASLGRAADPNIDTTCNLAVAAGQMVITPGSMAGIAPGALLIIDAGDSQEIVTVTATTATTFSAVTVWAHNGTTTPFPIRSLSLLGISVPETSGGWLNLLGPLQTTRNVTGGLPGQYLSPTAQTALCNVLLSLLDFARMKQSLSPSDERLLGVLENPGAVLPNGQTALVSLTGWTIPSVNALLTQFFASIQLSSLGTVENFRRVFDAYALVQKCRISAAALIYATTTAPTANTVSALQSSLRALYADSDWQTVIQPINDAMRIKQRDALVAYILQQPFAAQNNILTADDLFAYFLLDTQTQPPVQTSRIRLALSSVQLFIERCVRNLEPSVATSDIDAAQWSWMKRYRVWQANREIFLWPENWLYPELRDDASPFFTSMMSRLLQSDITDDAASNAYLDYLTSLEEVAKLEPCGIYYVAGTPNAGEVSYVIARTAGAKRKYYFRQLQFGSWTPWTEVQIECEGLPLTPIVWNGRLFLFWLKAIKQQSQPQFAAEPTGANNDVFATLTPGAAQENAQASVQKQTVGSAVTVGAVLCWSEFYNNKWQPTKTSDMDRPTILGNYDPAGSNAFEYAREQLSIVPGLYGGENAQRAGVTQDLSSTLLLSIQQSNGSAQNVPPTVKGGFLLHNTHSRPIRFEDVNIPDQQREGGLTTPIAYLLDTPNYYRWFSLPSDYSGGPSILPISISYMEYGNYSFTELFATNLPTFQWAPTYTQSPPSVDNPSPWASPFFYEDRRNVFYTTVSLSGPGATPAAEVGFGAAPATMTGRPLPKGLPLLSGSSPSTRSQEK